LSGEFPAPASGVSKSSRPTLTWTCSVPVNANKAEQPIEHDLIWWIVPTCRSANVVVLQHHPKKNGIVSHRGVDLKLVTVAENKNNVKPI
jgi:hypothetical protein